MDDAGHATEQWASGSNALFVCFEAGEVRK